MNDPIRMMQCRDGISRAVDDLQSGAWIKDYDKAITASILVVEAFMSQAPDDLTLDEFKTMWNAIRRDLKREVKGR